MKTNLVSRRSALKYAGLIAVAAQSSMGLPGYAATIRGYGTDPDLLNRIVTWPKILSPSELTTLTALCDIVLPADPPHPSAGSLKVHEFVDEWVSAPYPQMMADKRTVLEALKMLDVAMSTQHRVRFSEAGLSQQISVFDSICNSSATVILARRLIDLICDGYYTTREGHAAIGYVGNIALERFPGTTPAVKRHLEERLRALPANSTASAFSR